MCIEDLEQFKKFLKKYQYEAACKAINFLLSSSEESALIHLPTGTGKTGVMATICAITDQNILIIVPNASLPQQLKYEIKKGFWNSINFIDIPELKVVVLNNKSQFNDLHLAKNTIFISTIQFLQVQAYFDGGIDEALLNNLNLHIKYVFFDEGHREPATKWSKIIRVLKAKIILFTATPYRNDNSVFKIDNDHVYSRKLSDFIRNNDISSVNFLPLGSSGKKRSALKAKSNISNNDLLKIVNQNLEKGKILIRCEGKNNIEEITDFLNNNGIKTVGLHSGFNKTGNFLNCGKDVLLAVEEYNVYVHCDMIIEGINIPVIKTIIFLDTFSNFRSTVQQIGRALRKTEKSNEAQVYLPNSVLLEHIKQWEYLLDYSKESDNLKVYTYSNGLIKKLYVDKYTTEIENDILIPQKATIYFTVQEELWTTLSKKIINEIEEDLNCEIIYKRYEEKVLIVYFIENTYSPFLKSLAFENRNLQVCVFSEVKSSKNKGSYYFYFNSNNSKIFNDKTSMLFSEEGLKNFTNLIDNNVEITKAKYEKAAPLSSTTIRGREIIGSGLQSTSESLDQKLSFCRNVTGKSSENTVRYINPITSRISDSDFDSIDEYINWCKEIVDKLENEEHNSNRIFKRFAKISAPAKEQPAYIFIEFKQLYEIAETSEYLDDISAEIDENSKFNIQINGDTYKYKIEKNPINYQFEFKLPNSYCDDDFALIDKNTNYVYLKDVLNKSNFRLYFLKEQLIYTKGKYYSPNIKTVFKKAEDWSLIKDITPLKNLESDKCLYEKAMNIYSNTLPTWPDNSVFGVIIKEILENHETIDYLVCDDMGTEIADFIAMDSQKNKIIYIHCKRGENKLSASTFQDICGQAQKNIRYIINTSNNNNKYLKNRETKWETNWPYYAEGRTDGTIDRCVFGGTSDEIYNQFIKMIDDPNTEYEVWLVHSGLSYKNLKNELTKSERQSEELPQLIWLLQSTQDFLSEAGAKIKIYCAP